MSVEAHPFKFGEVLSDDVKEVARQCPAFQDEVCPFAGKENNGALDVPASHLDSKHQGSAAIKTALAQVHKEGSTRGDQLSQCPVFKESVCPYKDSQLASLVHEMDLRSWGVRIESLANALKEGTADAHQEAETVQWVQQLLKREVPRLHYAMFLAMLYHVYDALETAGDRHATHEPYSFIHFPETLGGRAAAIMQDINELTASTEETESLIRRVLELPVLQQYVASIRDASAELLVAHTYTRYLGDLSGGQIIKRAVVKAYSKQPAFYDFPGLDTNKKQREFKKMYRHALDTLPVTARVSHVMVQEANAAFRFNTDLFRYLDSLAGVVAPVVQHVPLTDAQKKEAKCPFHAPPATKDAPVSGVSSFLNVPMMLTLAIAIVVALIAFDAASFV